MYISKILYNQKILEKLNQTNKTFFTNSETQKFGLYLDKPGQNDSSFSKSSWGKIVRRGNLGVKINT